MSVFENQAYQSEFEFRDMCEQRKHNGYNSGMGEIFRKVCEINPITRLRSSAQQQQQQQELTTGRKMSTNDTLWGFHHVHTNYSKFWEILSNLCGKSTRTRFHISASLLVGGKLAYAHGSCGPLASVFCSTFDSPYLGGGGSRDGPWLWFGETDG